MGIIQSITTSIPTRAINTLSVPRLSGFEVQLPYQDTHLTCRTTYPRHVPSEKVNILVARHDMDEW